MEQSHLSAEVVAGSVLARAASASVVVEVNYEMQEAYYAVKESGYGRGGAGFGGV